VIQRLAELLDVHHWTGSPGLTDHGERPNRPTTAVTEEPTGRARRTPELRRVDHHNKVKVRSLNLNPRCTADRPAAAVSRWATARPAGCAGCSRRARSHPSCCGRRTARPTC